MLNRLKLGLSNILLNIANWFLWLSVVVFPKACLPKEPEYFITDVVNGPIHVKDIPFEEVPVGLVWDKDTVMLDVRMLVDGKLQPDPATIYCQWDKAQDLLDHFNKGVTPVRIN